VRTIAGQPDIQITRRDGTTFQVDLSNLNTIQDVIDTINAADAGGGVTASFSTTGNGIVLTDTTAGTGTLTVTPLNYSLAADDLGLRVAASGATLTGTDTNAIQSNGLLANLAKLHDAMVGNDQAGMTKAAEALQDDLGRVTRISGRVGAQVQEMEQRQQRLEDQDLATRALLSQLEDTDYNEAVTRFTTLQTALQANLQSTGRILNMTLLDFLS
jgi:flagellin-like hook-associated protein FlgL